MDGGVHSLWFLLSEQYQSFVSKIQQFSRVRLTLSFQSGVQIIIIIMFISYIAQSSMR